ncbi:MAG: ECF transporter S component [Clostridia bacterium]|nr:ECF transporter S component [Clostridia bacterium]
MKTDNKTLKLSYTAALAALCCATTFIHVPSATGYLHLGDSMVFLALFFLGPCYGAAAAGVGCGLADLILGYDLYIPATCLIKAAMLLLFFAFAKAAKKHAFVYILYGVCAVLFEALAYFAYEALILKYGLAVLPNILGNLLQGGVGYMLALTVRSILSRKRVLK